MLNRILREVINTNAKVNDVVSILFSTNNVTRDKYNLSYLGEVLERHTERELSVDEVLQGIALGYSDRVNLFDESINTNQLSLFKERFVNSNNYNPISHIGYICLMLLVEKDNYEAEVINFLNKNKLDENFLILVEAFNDSTFKLTDTIKGAVALKLQQEKFIVDFNKLLDTTSRHSYDYSVYSHIRDILKIFDFKSGDFKNKEVFKILNSYKKIGSNRINKIDSVNMLKCFGELEDVFWLLNLKIAKETLSPDGNAILTAVDCFTRYISESIDISRENFEMFSRIKKVSFLCIDFSNLEESRFDKLIYLLKKGLIHASDIGKAIYNSSAFIEIMKSSLKNLILDESTFTKTCLDIIKDTDDMSCKEFFFNVIKENNCYLNAYNYANLHQEGLLEFKDCILKTNLETFVETLYQSNDYSNEELAGNILVAFTEGCIESRDIYTQSLSYYNRGSYYSRSISIVNFVYTNLLTLVDSICNENKDYAIELVKNLENFLFRVSSSRYNLEEDYYVKFILKALDNEFYLEALELSKDDAKEIAKTLLTFKNISNSSTLHFLNTHAYSEKEANLLKLEVKYEKLKTHILERYSDISISTLDNFFKEAEDLDTKEYYTTLLCELLEGNKDLNVARYLDIVIILFSLGVISKEKRDVLVSQKIDLMCERMSKMLVNQ